VTAIAGSETAPGRLELAGVTCRFGGLRALNGVSFVLEPGTILGVIGPNGAGKSTFVNVTSGQVTPTGGRVSLDGRDLTGAPAWKVARAGLARTFQVVKPFSGLTARQNVACGAMFATGASRAAGLAAATTVLGRVGLAGREDVHPAELTVADQKRLELGRALAMSPRVLLLDELMAGLRPAETADFVALIRRLRSEDGISVVVIEHVMTAILAVADELLVLDQGAVLMQGEPRAVLADERVVSAYLGERFARRAAAGRDGERHSADGEARP
jgi:branched-chain amino acid transport system ATP-binding protein